MSISRLRRHTGIAIADLDAILDELEQEGKIIIVAGRRKSVMLKS